MRKIIWSLLELIFPSNIYCISCGRPILPHELYSLCKSCLETLIWVDGRTCEKCGKILQDWHKDVLCFDCGRTPHGFTRGFSCVQYGDKERTIIRRLKYQGKGYIARKLADIMKERILLENLTIHYIIPVPMFRKKEQHRGYNQAALLAENLAGSLQIPWDRKMLVRIRDTEPMNQLSPEERRANMTGAFSVKPEAAPLIAGRSILLIDDIFTTGSTADACASALIAQGAGQVYLLTFAAGPNENYRPSAQQQ